MELHGKNFIGSRLFGSGEGLIYSFDPTTGQQLEPAFHESTSEEADQALEIAYAAFQDSDFQNRLSRTGFLRRIADRIEDLGDSLVQRAMSETALPPARLEGERARTTQQIRMFADLIEEGSWVEARIDRALPDRKPLPRPDLRRMLVPLGPVVVFGASNFPLAFSVAGGDTASALAAGNPVVVKAHPAHPGTSELVASAIVQAQRECGMPEGVFSMLHGSSYEIGLHLARHPTVRAIGFTGSLSGGRALFDAAASRSEPIPVYAEMGSVNPVFILPRALQQRSEEIAQGLVQSFTLGVGQFCTNPGIVVGIAGPELHNFAAQLARLTEQVAPAVMLHSGIRQAFQEKTAIFSSLPEVQVMARSAQSCEPDTNEVAALLFTTTAERLLKETRLTDELFGPSTLLVSCRSIDQLMEVASRLGGHLTATFHATDEELTEYADLIQFVRGKVGRIILNGFPTGVEVSPAMHHGGPYPATTDSRSTSVGTAAILRFVRPICLQNFPDHVLPPELQNQNSSKIWRLIDGEFTQSDC